MRCNLPALFLVAGAFFSQSGYSRANDEFNSADRLKTIQNPALNITIDFNKQEQTIQNIGTSFCWFAEPIGKNFPIEKRRAIAELLFSKDTLADGTPKGIGVSSFRFNIGAGSAEQETGSRIKDPNHRTECFLSADGTYDWNKQIGYQWFLKSANAFRVENLIAFHNSPPVFFNKNGLAHKSVKEETSNLREDKYEAYSDFISSVIKHFDKEGVHFKYISPVNEPQWEWRDAKQEGSPWTNLEIAEIARAIDKSFIKKRVDTQILIPEAAMITHLNGETGKTKNQIDAFLNPSAPGYIGNLKHLAPVVASHSYFTDNGNKQIVQVRKGVKEKLAAYPQFSYWQSEYCLLGNGYKDGLENPSEIDGALFLAKIIHNDLVAGNAAAWQFWNAIEPTRNFDGVARYYLIAMNPNANWTDGEFKATKNLYALGHFSRFVRPGMKRIAVENDQLTDEQAAAGCMISTFVDVKKRQLVIIAINYTDRAQPLNLNYVNFPKGFKMNVLRPYVTTGSSSENLKATKSITNSEVILPARSISTMVNKISDVLPDPDLNRLQ